MTAKLDKTDTPFETVDAIEAYLQETATMPMEEPGLFELEHGLQCAAELEACAPDDIELQIAGLVHDICHGRCHIRVHDRVGAGAVRAVLGDRVAELVGLHVAAKRYLVATDRSYAARLSPISKTSLDLQGGAMTQEEISAFEKHPLAQEAMLLRMADEAAKTPGRIVPGLDHWRGALR
ncbi:hypothetical protein [Parvibaculum sp.]|uniref:hypothetical protein n=1 Tax=Parvibaculum sp. TaxID=2024848 RepID=UPI002D00F600|nr:hypothetical protein [Parvibaculum sp.]HUD52106.1 hypothetical protein [Parvibaculum sp.]